MSRQAALGFMALIILTLSLAACGDVGGDSTPTAVGVVGSPPPPAPASVVEKTAAVLGVPGTVTQSVSGGPAQASQAEGTSTTFVSEDPGGSGDYIFNPAEFTFQAGETVNFSMTAETEFHTFTVDELGIDVSADGGESVSFTFTFDRSGTFSLICIPHEAFGMLGTITVR